MNVLARGLVLTTSTLINMNIHAERIVEQWAHEKYDKCQSWTELMQICEKLIDADCLDIAENLKKNWREAEKLNRDEQIN